MCVLFLDVDGVLNSSAYLLALGKKDPGIKLAGDVWNQAEHLDPTRVARLNTILDATGCKVVLSSAWRCSFTLGGVQQFLRHRGFTGRLHDTTPRLHGRERHVEIKAWLSQRGAGVDRYAILDDDQDAGVGFGHRFVRTLDGIEDEHVERVVQLLGRSAAGAP